MRGLVAIISHDRMKRIEAAEISELATAFESLRGAGKRYSANAGEYARVVRINTTNDSHIEIDGQSWLCRYGLIYHEGPLLKQPLESLDGQFALVSYDAPSGVIRVATDPFGMQALYVAEREGRTYVSTSALALAKHLRARPSQLGIEAFLRAGNHFGCLTNWEGIERLEPGESIRFTDRGPQRQTYWRPSIDEDLERLSLTQAADHVIDVATEAFQKYLGTQTEYFTNLTGGYDSRLLNLLLSRAGVRFATHTRGDNNEPDVRIAAEVAKAAGWEWRQVRVPDQLQPEMIQSALAWGDGQMDILDLANALWYPPDMRNDVTLLNGAGGELLRDSAWQQELFKVGKSTRVAMDDWLDMRCIHSMDTSILARDPTAEVRENFRCRMTEFARPYASRLNTIQLDMIFNYKCTGHFGLFGPAYGAYGLVQSPFYFKPIANAAMSLDWRHRIGHGLLRQIINRLDPRLAAIRTTSGGPAQPMRITNFHRYWFYYSKIGLRLIHKLSEKAVGRAWFRNPNVAKPRLIMGWENSLSPTSNGTNGHRTNGELRSAPLFNRSQLEAFLRRAHEPKFQDVGLLGRILMLELSLRAADSSF